MHRRAQSRPAWQRAYTPAELRLAAETRPAVERMADLFVERMQEGKDTDHFDLEREGFSQAEVIQHAAAAAGMADKRMAVDRDDDRVAYDREARVKVGANAIAGLLLKEPGTIHTACRQAGLRSAEVGNLWPDLIGEAMRIVRETRAAVAVQ